ncbi:MAG: DUF11 domain-containing protein [Caldilineaceae bacterium]|nr:DUF11 domain-containing protein [Caldilineaceae bacterium]
MKDQLMNGLFLTFARRFGMAVVAVSCAIAAVIIVCGVSAQANGENVELDTATETAIAISLLADAPYVDIISDRGPFGGYAYGKTEDYGIGIEQAALAETSLSLRYTTAVTEITLGGIIPYTLTITNAGTQPITDAALSVALPNCLTLVPDSLHSTLTGIVHDSSLSQLQWRGALTAARSETVTWQMTTPVDLVYCEQLLSYAQLTHDALSEPLREVIEVSYRLPTIFAPIVTKRASVTTVVPGGEIEFAVTVENVGETPILGSVLLRDFMPPDGRYVPGSLITDDDVLTATYAASLPPQIIWQSPLPPLSKREFRYRVRLLERVQCGAALYNLLTAESVIDLQASVLAVPITVVCPEPVQFTDFGDAPDSDSNHHGLNNTAYIDDGTLGHFPTVWEGTPAGEPSGPTHGTAHFWLGSMVDAEPYADLNLYEESNQIPPPPASNILDNGLTDIADSDLDDGWWNQGVPMLHCEPTMLIIALSRAALPANIDTLWLNVWFDGNRDGDWQDVGDCPGTNKETGETAYEWIVQDYEIDPATLSVEEPLVLYVPTMRVLNQQPDRKAWLRMTLSEQKAIVPVNGGLPDGRGPAYPNYFAVGETEDWLMAGVVVDNTQPFTTELEISGATPAMATLGTEITYLHFLTLDNDATPAIAELTHRLPAEVTLTNPPTITPNTIEDMYNEHLATLNAFTPFPATFDSTQGARGTIHWRGQMPGAGHVFIEYTVRIDSCPPPDQTDQPQLHSVITIRQADGTDHDLPAMVPVDCVQNERPAQQLYLPIVSR